MFKVRFLYQNQEAETGNRSHVHTEVPVKVLLLCFSWVKIHDGRLLYSRRRCALTLQEFAVRTPSEEEEDARPRKHSRVGKIC